MEERLGAVEREQARQGERIGRMEVDLSKVSTGVDKLLDRDAKRPQPMTFATIAATCVSIGAVAGVVWWLIGSAPAVVDMGKRLDRLDDPDIGRVTRLEREAGWSARIVRSK